MSIFNESLYLYTLLKQSNLKVLNLKTLSIMKRKIQHFTLIAMFLVFGSLSGLNAQEINQATEAFNKALELQTSDPENAIASLKTCLEICEQIGEDADDLKARAELKLPELYYNLGNRYVKDKKILEAIPAYEEAITVSKKYGTPEVEAKAKNMLPQLHNAIAGNYYKKDEYEKALASLDKAIEVDPNYARAFYTKALVLKKMDNLDAVEKTVDQGIMAAENSRDNNNKNRIMNVGATTFLAEGVALLTDGKASEAEPLLTKAVKYDPENPDVYYYLATARNEMKKWDGAVEAANKGLSLEDEDVEKKAKHYYALGMALKGKGDKAGACAAMQNAVYGQVKAVAEYEIEHGLECSK